MAIPAIILEAQGKQTITFTVPLHTGRKVHMEGLLDPMDLGPEALAALAYELSGITRVFTETAHFNWALAAASQEDFLKLIETWLGAAGLGRDGLGLLKEVMEKLDLVEADLQLFYQVDIRDWFTPGGLSTRRVLSLVRGLEHRTDSLFWASFSELDPMDLGALISAQLWGLWSGEVHKTITAKRDRKNAELQEEQMKRIQQRGF